MTRQAVIDVGTNSVKFHVGERQADGTWTTIVDRADVSRLGEGIKAKGAITPAAMERTALAIAGMTAEAGQLGVDGVTAVGTMGLRTATNSQEFLHLVKDRCGVRIEVISGDEECRIAYLAARSAVRVSEGTLIVFDTGGGSSQFTFGNGNRVERQFSLNVGAVRYTEQFHLDQAVSADVLKQALAAIAWDLLAVHDEVSYAEAANQASETLGRHLGTRLEENAHDRLPGRHGRRGHEYHRRDARSGKIRSQQSARSGHRSNGNRPPNRALSSHAHRGAPANCGTQPKRAEVILAGACVVRTIMNTLRKSSLSVSDRGLRHGILIDRFGGQPA